MPFVNRCGNTPKLQTKTVTPTTNQQIITPDTGYEGIDKVIVNAPALQTKTVTTGGTVTPDEGYVGIEKLIVDTPCYVFESTSSENYIDTDSYKYGLRKFQLDGISEKFTTYPDIIYILLMDTNVILNSANDYMYYHSLLLLPANRLGINQGAPESTALSNPNDNLFYSNSKTWVFDRKNVYTTASTVVDYTHSSASYYWVSFIEDESSFLIGLRDIDTNEVYTSTLDFGGNNSMANTYKAYFIWLETLDGGGS